MSRETPFPVGVVDNLEDKNDEHSTRKSPHNTTLGPESEDSRPHNTTLGSESELVGELEDNSSSSGQKGYHSSAGAFLHNTLVPKSEQPAGVVLEKGYVMVCNVCGVDNCRSGYNRPFNLGCPLW